MLAWSFYRDMRTIDGTDDARDPSLRSPSTHALNRFLNIRQSNICRPQVFNDRSRYVMNAIGYCRTTKAEQLRDSGVIRVLADMMKIYHKTDSGRGCRTKTRVL